MNNFNLFSYAWELFKNNPEIRTSEPSKDFISGIDDSFKNSKLFEVEPEIKKLLLLTKPTKTEPLLPFENIFLDIDIQEEGFKLIGLLIREGELYKDIDKNNKIKVGTGLRITTFMKTQEEGTFITFNPSGKGHLEIVIKGEKIKNKVTSAIQKKLIDFVNNFINFVNSPDVEVVEVTRSDKNIKRRIKQGKSILPNSKKIVLKGKTKIYLNQLLLSGNINYSHKFWVRGHFRQYKKHNTQKIWIMPYIKGKGVLIEKKYKLCKENKLK